LLAPKIGMLFGQFFTAMLDVPGDAIGHDIPL